LLLTIARLRDFSVALKNELRLPLWRRFHKFGLRNVAKKGDVSQSISCMTEGTRLENLRSPIKFVNQKDPDHHVKPASRIKASSLPHHRRVGLRAQLRASFANGHSGSEIILVRLDRLRAWRQSAG